MRKVFLFAILATLVSAGTCPFVSCSSTVSSEKSSLEGKIADESDVIKTSLEKYEEKLKVDKAVTLDNYKLLEELERLGRLRALSSEQSAFYLKKIYEDLQLKIDYFDINDFDR